MRPDHTLAAAPALGRRRMLQLSGCAGALVAMGPAALEAATDDLPEPIRALAALPDDVPPIGAGEHRARLAQAQRLLAESGLAALVIGPGSSLLYFSGADWGLSERFLGLVIGRSGEPVWIAPAFERDRALEQIRGGGDIRCWQEHESPYAQVAQALRDRGAATGRIGIEETMPFGFADGIAQALPAARLGEATAVTAGCRMVKDAHEIALVRRACALTLRAYAAVFESLRPGLLPGQLAAWVGYAMRRLGAQRGGALVLFGPDAAFPHGTAKPRALREGDLVLIDGGCRVHEYQSDVTRTGVFGARPSERQRRIYDVVRRAQQAAFRTARPGVSCEEVDRAARRAIEEGGFGAGYQSMTHRLGHGIGLDGHEWPYLVRGSTTTLRPGITFTDEPGIYIPGELGVRLEDTVAVTDDGCRNLCPAWSGSLEDPAGRHPG